MATGHITPVKDAHASKDSNATGTPVKGAGLFAGLTDAYASVRDSVSNLLELVSLEAHRAGIALMWMAAWGIFAGVCMVSAWLGLIAILALWSVSLGLPLIVAILMAVILNLVAGAVLIYMCINRSGDLLFPATRRQISGKPPVNPVSS